MKRPALVLLACLLFASISFAQQNDANAPASKADVERFLDAMHTRDMTKSMMNAMTVQMHKMVHEQVLKQPNLPPDSEERLNKLTDSVYKEMPVDELIDVMIPVYQKHFTKGDMDALVAFYSSPTGEKMVKELPAVMGEGMQAMMPIMRKSVEKMTERAEQEVAQMMKGST